MRRPGGEARDRGGDEVAAREAALTVAAARTGAHRPSERFTDLYVWVFCGVFLAVWVLSFARETFAGRVCSSGESGGCALQQSPTYAALAVSLLGLGALVLAVGAVGPVSAARAVARWMLGTTAERAVLLRGALLGVVGGSALGGVVVGLLGSMAVQGGGLEPAPLALGALLGAACGALVPLLLLGPQAAAPYGGAPGVRVGRGLATLGLLLLTWLLVVGPGATPFGAPEPASAPWAVVVPLLLLTVGLPAVPVLLLLRPGSRLAELSDAQLARGRQVVDAVADSTMMMDTSPLVGLGRRRSDRGRGRHRSRGLRFHGAAAFLVADLHQMRRRWRTLVPVILVVPGLLVVAEGFGHGGVVLAGVLVASWVGRRAGQGLRVWISSDSLRRNVRVAPWQVAIALSAAPLALTALVAVPAVALSGAPWWMGLHLALAGLAATIRSAEPAQVELGAVVATPAGALPVGLVQSVLHGPDVALVLGLLLLVVDHPAILLAALAAVGRGVAAPRR